MLLIILPALAQNDTRVTYIHTDADGTPFAATDEQGNLEWQIEHLPFGGEHSNTEVRRNSNLSFAGKMYDEEIGLSYFGGRWYDPASGRFTGIDPMPVSAEDWKTFNRYVYGNNNPYKYVDPDGNLPILIPLVIFLAKEGVAEVAGRYTGGATDLLSVRRMSSKLVKKSLQIIKRNKSGTAELRKYDLDTGPHYSIKVKDTETDQIITDAAHNTSIRNTKNLPKPSSVLTLKLPDTKAANSLQKKLIGTDTGTYSVSKNSCLHHCADVLKAGGSKETVRTLYKKTK
ncbi:MAG: RHS repeat domain-containing protein [Arenicella sp.]